MTGLAISGQRFLIVRLTAIGDCMHALPIANALRAHFPSSFIAWAVEGGVAKLLDGHPAVDEIIALPRRFYYSGRTLWNLARRLRKLRFDVTIDPQGLSKSSMLSLLAGARFRLGFTRPDGKEMSRWFNNVLVAPTRAHVVERGLELLGPLGVQEPRVVFGLAPNAAGEAVIADFRSQHDLSTNYAILNPGAGWPSKLWPPQRFAAVARHLGQKHGLVSVVVWAGPAEHGWAREIATAAQGYGVLAPSTSLSEFAALARSACLMISSDSGPLHIAAAVDTPCIGLFGPKPAQRNGAYGPRSINLQKASPSGKIRHADNSAMLAIDVPDVCAACDQLLAKMKSRAA